jgi:hypothetical protein
MRFGTLGLCALVLVALSCNSTTATRSGVLTIVSGNAQSDSVGQTLPLPLVVKLFDQAGNPVSGATIQWTAKKGGGVVSPSTSTVAADGTAQTAWTLGLVATDSDFVTAQLAGAAGAGSMVKFTARVHSGGTVSFVIVGGDQQSGEIGRPLPESLAVKAVDSYGNGVDSAGVSWYSVRLDGYLPITYTSPTGISRLQWTMSHTPQKDSLFVCTLTASRTTTYCLSFHGTATATQPYGLTLVSGGGQSSVASIPLPADIVVQVKDAVGQPVGGVLVTYHVVPGNAVYRLPRYFAEEFDLQPTTLSTDTVDLGATVGDSGTGGYSSVPPGQSAITWAAGIGPSTLTVTAPGTTPLTVPATGLAFTTSAMGVQRSACALGTGGIAYCWGYSQFVPDTFALYPTQVPGTPAFASFGNAGANAVCAITPAGVGYCWGAQVPQPPTTPGVYVYAIQSPTAISGPPLSQIVQGAGLNYHTGGELALETHRCLLASGAALCYGQNFFGEVGDGMPTPGDTVVTSPTPVVGGHTFVALAAGANHTCGIVTGGAVYCWGSDSRGQLGDGAPATQQASPVLVSGLTASAIGAGGNATCALNTSGVAYCWGDNSSGLVGLPSGQEFTTPVALSTSARFVTLAMNGGVACGLTAGGAAYCWGTFYASAGPITYAPYPLGNPIPLTTISTDGNYTVCGLTASNAAMCAGSAQYTGDGFFNPSIWSLQPVAVAPPGDTLPSGYTLSRVAARPHGIRTRRPPGH